MAGINYFADNTTLSLISNVRGNTSGDDYGPSQLSVVAVAILLCAIDLVGIVGNILVLLAIFFDVQMRKSVTNWLLANLAVADLTYLLSGLPDNVMFIINEGKGEWLLGLFLCKLNRFAQVTGIYASIQSLVALCIERHIAIAHPLQAQVLSSRKRIVITMTIIWIAAGLCGLPTAFGNVLQGGGCMLSLSNQEMLIFKYSEFTLFYFVPLVLQAVLYTITCRKLFSGVRSLHHSNNGLGRVEKSSEAIRARHGVVKMLVASVIIYFLSYSPHQFLLFYNTFCPRPFQAPFIYTAFTITFGHVNAAANPILYAIFSQNFRRRFLSMLFRMSPDDYAKVSKTGGFYDSNTGSTRTRNAQASTSV